MLKDLIGEGLKMQTGENCKHLLIKSSLEWNSGNRFLRSSDRDRKTQASIQPDVENWLFVLSSHLIFFFAPDTGGSIKRKKTRKPKYLFVIWQKDKLFQKHKYWCIQVRELRWAIQRRNDDAALLVTLNFLLWPSISLVSTAHNQFPQKYFYIHTEYALHF